MFVFDSLSRVALVDLFKRSLNLSPELSPERS